MSNSAKHLARIKKLANAYIKWDKAKDPAHYNGSEAAVERYDAAYDNMLKALNRAVGASYESGDNISEAHELKAYQAAVEYGLFAK